MRSLRALPIALLFGLFSSAPGLAIDDLNTLGLPLPPGFATKQVAPDLIRDPNGVLLRLPANPLAVGPAKDAPSVSQPPPVVIGTSEVGFFNPNDVALAFRVTIGAADTDLKLESRQIVTLQCSPCENATATIGTDASFSRTSLAAGTLYVLKGVDNKWTVVGGSQ